MRLLFVIFNYKNNLADRIFEMRMRIENKVVGVLWMRLFDLLYSNVLLYVYLFFFTYGIYQ